MACNHSVLLFGQYSVCLDVLHPSSGGNRLRQAQLGRAPGTVTKGADFEAVASDTGVITDTTLTGGTAAPAAADKIRDTPGFCLGVDAQLRVANGLFFVTAVGVAAVWGSMSAAVSVWTAHGDSVWPVMVAVYNAIGLPFLVLQLRYDGTMDRRLTPYRAYWLRMVSSLLLLVVVAFSLPALAGDGDSATTGGPDMGGDGHRGASVGAIVGATAVVGIAVAGAYSWLFQLATFYHARSVAWALGGVGMSAVIFLCVLIAQHFAFDAHTLPQYWRVTQGLTTTGLACTALLLLLPISTQLLAGDTKHTLRERLLDDGDAAAAAVSPATPTAAADGTKAKASNSSDGSISAGADADSAEGKRSALADVAPGRAVALVVSDPGQKPRRSGADNATGHGSGNNSSAGSGFTATTKQRSASQSADDRLTQATMEPVSAMALVRRAWQLELSALLVNMTVVGLAAAVTSLPHRMPSGQLSTLLLVVGGLSGFVGNELCVVWTAFRTPRALLIAVLVRMGMFALMFVYALSGLFVNDFVPLFLLGLLGLSGGFCNGRAYVLAAALSEVSEEKRRLSTLLSLFEYIGVYFGIAFAFTVRAIIAA